MRFRAHSRVETSNVNVQIMIIGIGPGGTLTPGRAPVVTGAVVPTFTVTVCVPVPLICTEELDRLQVGAGVAAGVMAQLRFTVPVNDPVGASARLKFAVCPAVMVWEVAEPDAAPNVKLGGAAWTVIVTPVLCTLLPEVP